MASAVCQSNSFVRRLEGPNNENVLATDGIPRQRFIQKLVSVCVADRALLPGGCGANRRARMLSDMTCNMGREIRR